MTQRISRRGFLGGLVAGALAYVVPGKRRPEVTRARPQVEALEERWCPTGLVCTWTGAVSTDWTDPGNWKNGVAPGNADEAYFTGDPTNGCVVNSSVSVGSIVANNYSGTNATFDIGAGATLTLAYGSGTPNQTDWGQNGTAAPAITFDGSSSALVVSYTTGSYQGQTAVFEQGSFAEAAGVTGSTVYIGNGKLDNGTQYWPTLSLTGGFSAYGVSFVLGNNQTTVTGLGDLIFSSALSSNVRNNSGANIVIYAGGTLEFFTQTENSGGIIKGDTAGSIILYGPSDGYDAGELYATASTDIQLFPPVYVAGGDLVLATSSTLHVTGAFSDPGQADDLSSVRMEGGGAPHVALGSGSTLKCDGRYYQYNGNLLVSPGSATISGVDQTDGSKMYFGIDIPDGTITETDSTSQVLTLSNPKGGVKICATLQAVSDGSGNCASINVKYSQLSWPSPAGVLVNGTSTVAPNLKDNYAYFTSPSGWPQGFQCSAGSTLIVDSFTYVVNTGVNPPQGAIVWKRPSMAPLLAPMASEKPDLEKSQVAANRSIPMYHSAVQPAPILFQGNLMPSDFGFAARSSAVLDHYYARLYAGEESGGGGSRLKEQEELLGALAV